MSIVNVRDAFSARMLHEILAAVAIEFGTSPAALRSPRRHKPLPQARAEFCRRAWALDLHSAPQIGSIINRDHSSVLYFLGRLKNKRMNE